MVASSPDSVLSCSLKEQKNLNSFFAVMFGVSSTAISRLAKTWEVSAFGLLVPARSPEVCSDGSGSSGLGKRQGSRQTLHP